MNDLKKPYTMDDITNGLDKQMKISKVKKTKAEKAEDLAERIANTPAAAPGDKARALKLKHKNKRNRKQLGFN